MKPSFNISKLTPPQTHKVLYRPRLFHFLEKNHDKKLILVFGQAAQGKTTLIASFMQKSNLPFAWVNLEKEDSDPAHLFQSIVLAFGYALKDLDLSPLLSLSYSSTNSSPKDEKVLFQEWINAIAQNIQSPIRIVLDGLEQLIFESSSYRFLQAFVNLLPPHIQVFLLSRTIPPKSFEFQTLKMKQSVLILKNEDLAFTKGEIKEFFRHLRSIEFDSDQLQKIQLATEGWAGGLILLSEALSRFPSSFDKDSIIQNLPDYFQKEVFQYFGKEIFDSQPKDVQDFLIQSSLIDLIEPDFIKELTGLSNAEEVLRDHVRKNLFVQSFHDEKKGWLFKYHQMFRNFLKAKLRATLGEKERNSLLMKAGLFYEKRNEPENAIHYFLEAGAFSNAVSIIEQIGLDLLKIGRKDFLYRWMEALPEDLITGNPWLLYYRSVTRRFIATDENLSNLQKALTLFGIKGDIKGLLLSLACFIEMSVLRGHDLIPLSVLIERAEELLDLRETEPYFYEKAVLYLQMGFGLTVRGGNPRKGFGASQNAYIISKKLGDIPLRINALVNGIQSLCWLGEFDLADAKLNELKKLVEKHPDPGVRVLYQLGRCEYSVFKGEYKKAGELIQITTNEAERYGLPYLFPVTMVYDLMLKPHLEQYREAEEVGARLIDFTSSIGNSFLKGVALLFLGRSFYFEGNDEKAKDFLDRSFRILSSPEVRAECHLPIIAVINGFISSHLGEQEEAEAGLQNALNYFNSMRSFLSADANLALALLNHSRGKVREAIEFLKAGLKIAKDKGVDSFPLTSPGDLMQICILAFILEVKDVIDFVSTLLTTRLACLAEKELKRNGLSLRIHMHEKFREIRRAVHRSKVPHLRIETLGNFKVFRGESLIEEKEWVRHQPKQLLKALLSHGKEAIPKEILIEDLWPEEEPGRAEMNFKTTLHRLRKILEPTLIREFGSSYIHLHGHEVSLDKDLCWVDYHQFFSLIQQGEAMEKRHEEKKALSLYVQAIELYMGDFLEEDPYPSWTYKKREELKDRYIELLHQVAYLYEKQGLFKKAVECHKKVIGVDPLLEESYQKLMTLYASIGMHSEALAVYETCRKVLKKELKAKPDSMTEALYKRIMEKTGIPPSNKIRQIPVVKR